MGAGFLSIRTEWKTWGKAEAHAAGVRGERSAASFRDVPAEDA